MKFTCLMMACAKKDKKIGAQIIQIIFGSCKDIDIDQQDLDGNTALIHAVVMENMEIVTLLINYGAKWALTNNHNEVAIDFCTSKNVIYNYLTSLGLKRTDLKDIERDTKKNVALSFVRKKKFAIKVRTELFFPDFLVE